jgi:hypothetical protein
MVETAIFLPIFLILIFFCYWLGVMSNTKAAFTVSIKDALHLATTRSDPLVVNGLVASDPSGSISQITTWLNTGTNRPDSLLLWNGTTSNLMGDANYGGNYRQTNSNGVLRNISGSSGISDISGLPASYIYTLVFIYQNLRQAVGDTVHYPCDPLSTASNFSSSGCLLCVFEKPDGSGGSFDPFTEGEGNIMLSCTFRPNTLIGEVLRALFSVATGQANTTPFVTMRQTALARSSNGFSQ